VPCRILRGVICMLWRIPRDEVCVLRCSSRIKVRLFRRTPQIVVCSRILRSGGCLPGLLSDVAHPIRLADSRQTSTSASLKTGRTVRGELSLCFWRTRRLLQVGSVPGEPTGPSSAAKAEGAVVGEGGRGERRRGALIKEFRADRAVSAATCS